MLENILVKLFKAVILTIASGGSAGITMIIAVKYLKHRDSDFVIALMLWATFGVPALLIYFFPWLGP